MDRRAFLVGAAALVGTTVAGAAAAPAAQARPRGRNLIKNGSFEKGPTGVAQIQDWVVTVTPL